MSATALTSYLWCAANTTTRHDRYRGSIRRRPRLEPRHLRLHLHWPRPTCSLMTVKETQHHMRNNLPVHADHCLSAGWVPNIVKVSVAPPLTRKTRIDYIQTVWQAILWEERRLPRYYPFSPNRDAVVKAEYNMRCHSSFFPANDEREPSDWWLQEEKLSSFEEEPEVPLLPPSPSCASHLYRSWLECRHSRFISRKAYSGD